MRPAQEQAGEHGHDLEVAPAGVLVPLAQGELPAAADLIDARPPLGHARDRELGVGVVARGADQLSGVESPLEVVGPGGAEVNEAGCAAGGNWNTRAGVRLEPLSKPYKSRAEAEDRLRQIEVFKRMAKKKGR